jgi:hypothetical protein
VPLGPSVRSIVGVAVMPISGVTWPQPRSSLLVSPAPSIDFCHRTPPVCASNAYTVSCSVAASTRSCTLPPASVTEPATSGCASTRPSTAHIALSPKWAVLTVVGVSVVSASICPVRAASLCQVSTSMAVAVTGVPPEPWPGPVGPLPAAPLAGPDEPSPLQAHRMQATTAYSARRNAVRLLMGLVRTLLSVGCARSIAHGLGRRHTSNWLDQSGEVRWPF